MARWHANRFLPTFHFVVISLAHISRSYYDAVDVVANICFD